MAKKHKFKVGDRVYEKWGQDGILVSTVSEVLPHGVVVNNSIEILLETGEVAPCRPQDEVEYGGVFLHHLKPMDKCIKDMLDTFPEHKDDN